MSVSGTELEFLREWSGWFCHKIPERSPHCGLEIFPVCCRCAGWQLGLALAYLQMFLRRGWRGGFPSVRVVLQCVTLMLPLIVDGFGNAFHLWSSPGWLRGLTGLGVGLSLPWLLAPLVHATDEPRQPALENLRPLILPVLVGVGAVAWLNAGCGLIWFRVFAVTASAGWVLFIGHFLLALIRAYGYSAGRQLRQTLFQRELKT